MERSHEREEEKVRTLSTLVAQVRADRNLVEGARGILERTRGALNDLESQVTGLEKICRREEELEDLLYEAQALDENLKELKVKRTKAEKTFHKEMGETCQLCEATLSRS